VQTSSEPVIFFVDYINPLSANDVNSRHDVVVACNGYNGSLGFIKNIFNFFERGKNTLQNTILNFA